MILDRGILLPRRYISDDEIPHCKQGGIIAIFTNFAASREECTLRDSKFGSKYLDSPEYAEMKTT
jgi:hypothetical protein